MDPYIAEVAQNHRISALLFLAAKVEFTVQDMGLMPLYVDKRGNGPYIQKCIELHPK